MTVVHGTLRQLILEQCSNSQSASDANNMVKSYHWAFLQATIQGKKYTVIIALTLFPVNMLLVLKRDSSLNLSPLQPLYLPSFNLF